jgi:hypothetical protein
MAKNLARILDSDMPRLPLRKAAEQLRKKGRGRDTILAHITPREAARLKAEGGSGTINPDTGLPEFEDGFDFGAFFDSTPIAEQGVDFGSASYTPEAVTQGPIYQAPTQDYTFLSQPSQGFQQPFQAAQYGVGFQPDISSGYYFGDQYAQATPAEIAQGRADVQNAYRTRNLPLDAATTFKAYGAPGSDVGSGEAIKAAAQQQMILSGQEEEDATIEQLRQREAEKAAGGRTVVAGEPGERAGTEDRAVGKAKEGMVDTPFGSISTKNLIAALGIGGLGANYLMAQSQGKSAAAQLKAAYDTAAAQSREQAQPFMQQGGQQLSQALTGALSPAQQQQLQAAQAQAAQGTAGRGGAGAAQAGRSIEDLRQRLLSSQQTMALQLLGAGTPLINSAIQSQLSGTTAGINTQMALSQQAGQAATGMLGMLAMMYGRSA